MRRHRRGQSLIEYSLIGTLVILSIIVMGPYVLRSINGHFKIWDDEIQDAHNERLTVMQQTGTTPSTCGGTIPSSGFCNDHTDCVSCNCIIEEHTCS